MVNMQDSQIVHDATIPVDGGGGEEIATAPFFQYNFQTDSPELLLTVGRNCNIHSRPLQARPQPYPLPRSTRRERLLFHTHERFTELVDAALEHKGDATLRAEVQQYRRSTDRARMAAQRLATQKKHYNSYQAAAYDSAMQLAEADAYNMLIPRIVVDIPGEELLPEATIRPAREAVQSS